MTVFQGRLLLSTLLLTLFLTGCQSRPNDAAHVLLETYMDGVTGFAGSSDAMLKSLDEQESGIASLKGQVPDAFIDRYRRLITTTRLVVAKKRDDRETQQIASFVQSVTGATPPAGENNLIIAAAGAFGEEVLRLDMLLDGETDRNKVRARYAERLRAKQRV
jgi:hypothetical protein